MLVCHSLIVSSISFLAAQIDGVSNLMKCSWWWLDSVSFFGGEEEQGDMNCLAILKPW